MSETSRAVKAQYERYPYPPVPAVALPRRDHAQRLNYQRGVELAAAAGQPPERGSSQGARILVAGGGTLEPYLVAVANPRAAEVVAVDLSAAATARLRQRRAWGDVADRLLLRRLRGQAAAPMRCLVADLWDWEGGDFDYIVASNVLHHSADPAGLLQRLAQWLKPGGLLRIVTYPRMSRYWLRQVGAWLALHGVGQNTRPLRREAIQALRSLPPGHPLRLCFEEHSESRHATGIADAFLHVCENPLAPLDWEAAAVAAGLRLVGEDQHPLSRSAFLADVAPGAALLSAWERLQVLDDLLELATSPVLWFTKTTAAAVTHRQPPWEPSPPVPGVSGSRLLGPATPAAKLVAEQPGDVILPSQVYWELGVAARRAAALLARVGVELADVVAALRLQVGSRVSRDGRRELSGLVLSDYPLPQLLAASQPWDLAQWRELATGAPRLRLAVHDVAAPGVSLAEQAQWLQLRYGPELAQIPLTLRW